MRTDNPFLFDYISDCGKTQRLKVKDIAKMNELYLDDICSPKLTCVATKNGMAIIKIDRKALVHLQKFAGLRNADAETSQTGYEDELKIASTNVFQLEPDGYTKIDVKFKLLLNEHIDEKKERSVSVFTEICDPDKITLKTSFAVTFFLRNIKAENGKSFKKRIKLSSTSFRIERGIVNFIPQRDINKILDEHSTLCFGILIECFKPYNNFNA